MKKETFKPKVLLQFIIPCEPKCAGYRVQPPREPSYLARIVQTHQGLHLEIEEHDAMGNASWRSAYEIPRWVKALIEACILSTPSAVITIPINHDTEMLNWLDENVRGYGKGWICRNSINGRELLTLRESAAYDAKPTVREAITAVMEKGL